MNEQIALSILDHNGAFLTNGHFVYTSGKHGSCYINKNALYPHTIQTSDICKYLAEQFKNDEVDVVIAPAMGGVILSQWTAHHLTKLGFKTVHSIFSEREEGFFFKAPEEGIFILDESSTFLESGDEIIIKKSKHVIKHGYEKLVPGKKVLVVEDILNTGSSVRKVIEATRKLEGQVVGVAALWNRGNVTAKDLANIPKLASLINKKIDLWDKNYCPLCKQNIPINTEMGKGREWLARKNRS